MRLVNLRAVIMNLIYLLIAYITCWNFKEKIWQFPSHSSDTYSLALRPSESLGLLNYGRPFFPIQSLLLPSLNLYLPQILLHILQPPQARSSSTCVQFTVRYFPNFSSLVHFTTCPIRSNLFFLICAAMSRYLCSSLNCWLVLFLLAVPLVRLSFLTF